jgi:hypothetical protein
MKNKTMIYSPAYGSDDGRFPWLSGDCRELQKARLGEVGEVFQGAIKLVILSTDIGAAYGTKNSGCSPFLLASEHPRW